LDEWNKDSIAAVFGIGVAVLLLVLTFAGCPLKDEPEEMQENPDIGSVTREEPESNTEAGPVPGIVPPEFDSDGKLMKIERPEAEWRGILTVEQFGIMRAKGTERPFCGDLLDNKREGLYVCAGCSLPLFESGGKFSSGTGWPSFFEPVDPRHVEEARDSSHGVIRTEITCARCGAHLGHVFDDGPKPTGRRYCVNSVSMSFIPQK
jgi:methionine-R-sulfoxide reductase